MNDDILYIDYLESYEEIIRRRKIPKIIKKIIYKIFNFLGFIKIEKNYLILSSTYEDVNNKTITNILKAAQKLNFKNVALAEGLQSNLALNKELLNSNFDILDGTKIYKFLTYEIINKIAYIQNIKIQSMEITFLTNNNSDINMESIKMLAQKCKVVNVLTERIDLFTDLEKQLYDDQGIIINVSRNKRKTCMYSDIILNLDFENKTLEQCRIREKTIIVQFTKAKFENKTGVTITSYKLNIPDKYSASKKMLKHFSNEILYEGLFYHKLSYKNVRKLLKKDNISIKYFIGNNGKISFREIKENHFKNNRKMLKVLDKFD